MRANLLLGMLFLLLILLPPTGQAQKASEWSTYNGNLAGQHYSSLRQIDRSNVKSLRITWSFHTDVFNTPGNLNSRASFEANPIVWGNRLYVSTPFDRVFAIEADLGKEIWSYDPGVNRSVFINIVASRGVALWHSSIRSRVSRDCNNRVFIATLDARLIAIDAMTGRPCDRFGVHGTVDLIRNIYIPNRTWYEVTSPPTVVGNVVIVGSSICDNQAVEEPSGVVRGFDSRSGKLLWSWEPIPWALQQHPRTGAGNAWSAMSADLKHGLVYVPTGSPSPDFYGAYRPGDNRDADSVIALDTATGKRVWGFQFVHHDLWDYDIAAEPILFQFRNHIPAIAITTKTGMVFVLNRLTGNPLYPIFEKPVPQSRVPGEKTSLTQPFSSLPNLAALTFNSDQVSGVTQKDHKFCHDEVEALVNQGIFTPISTKSTLLYPGSVGGVEWGGPAINPATAVMYAETNILAFDTRLVPRGESRNGLFARIDRKIDKWELHWTPSSELPVEQRFRVPDTAGRELSAQAETPYRVFRDALVSPDGAPCTPAPQSSIVAINLNTGKKLWSAPLDTATTRLSAISVSFGGPISTSAGLIFSASTSGPYLLAFDSKNGHELWRGSLPYIARATPMTYQVGKRQFVAIYAGGDQSTAGSRPTDSIVAFALPEAATHGHRRPLHR